MTPSACRLCGQPVSPTVRRSRPVAAGELLRARRRPAQEGSVLSAARLRLRALPARAARRVREPGAHLQRLRLFLVVLGRLARRTAGRTPTAWSTRFGLGAAVPGRRDRQQRRLPPAVLPAPRRAGPRRRAGRQRRAGGHREGRAHRGRLLRRRDGAARSRAARRRSRPDRRQQRARARAAACATSSQGFRILLKPEGVVTIEVPHLLRLVAREPVRHHLPRALLLLLAARPRARSSPRAACASSTSRSSGRTAARCASSSGTPRRRARRRDGGRRRARRASARPASTGSPTYDASPPQVVRTKCDVLAFFVEAARRGKRVVGYGAPAKGNTLLNYCGIGPELMRLHRRPQPAQAGPLPAGHAHPGPRAGSAARRPARFRVHPAVEPARRDRAADGRHPRVGRTLRRPDPDARRVLMRFTPTELAGHW